METKTQILDHTPFVNTPIEKIIDTLFLKGIVADREEYHQAFWDLMVEGKISLQVHNSPRNLSPGQKHWAIEKEGKYFYYAMKRE